MGNPEDKQRRIKRRRNYVLKDLYKKYKQKDHSPDEVYDRKKNNKKEMEYEND